MISLNIVSNSRFRNRGGVSSGITFALLKEWYSKQTDFPDDSSVFAQQQPPSTSPGAEQDDNLLMVSIEIPYFLNYYPPLNDIPP